MKKNINSFVAISLGLIIFFVSAGSVGAVGYGYDCENNYGYGYSCESSDNTGDNSSTENQVDSSNTTSTYVPVDNKKNHGHKYKLYKKYKKKYKKRKYKENYKLIKRFKKSKGLEQARYQQMKLEYSMFKKLSKKEQQKYLSPAVYKDVRMYRAYKGYKKYKKYKKKFD